tara:strand:+ start:17353 stop:18315 length:963 start_codon:yes stop_codon:yes gene_type:complete
MGYNSVMDKILVTGGAGFLGTHLIDRLLSLGHEVVCIDKNIDGIINNHSKGLTIIEADLLDYHLLDVVVGSCDYVIHLAALVGVKNGLDFPHETMENNFTLTMKIAELCMKHDIGMFFSSTSEIYGTNPVMPLREDSDRVIGPSWKDRWAYSDSKALAERMLISYSKSKGLKVKIGRLFNTVGPGQSLKAGMVMPTLISAAATGAPLTIYGNGKQTRSFCHVSDTVAGVLKVISDGDNAGVYNIGSCDDVTINQLARQVIKRLKSSSEIVYLEYKDLHLGHQDILKRVPDTSKLQSLGWSAAHSLDYIIDDIYTKDWKKA